MAPSSKSSSTSRRKSSKGIVILKISSKALQRLQLNHLENDETLIHPLASNSKDQSTKTDSSSGDTQLLETQTSDQLDTAISSSILLSTDSAKKKSNKRSLITALKSDGPTGPKIRGKPGPKKKSRLDDITTDQINTVPKTFNTTTIKLGPKANQGAINAGLRALDRSGKPCRKWAKENFKLKSFTGVCWEIPRWKAPPKVVVNTPDGDSNSGSRCIGTNGYSQAGSEQSDKSNIIVDTESESTSSQMLCSPAPQIPSSNETINTSVISSPAVTASA